MIEILVGLLAWLAIVAAPILFAAVAAAYWLFKGRYVMSLALAGYAVYFGSDIVRANDVVMAWLVLRTWFALAITVVVGGVAEYVVARIRGRRLS